jgi:HD-like signal output (HDOD) protein/CheY-like chemotaxis protein
VTAQKRIVFVDDDARVRETLQRLVRPLAETWDSVFAADAREALDQLSRQPFDVLVTDLAMPGMSGAQLLAETARVHPKVVRLVLAPITDQPLVMTCGSLVHQFLSRPIPLATLRAAIDRACDVETTVRREQIGRLVARMDRLPSLPDLYHKMVEKMGDPECSIDEIGELIARDISMTARILKLVNSAFFGLRYRVSSPNEAVNYLGLDTIKALVLSINAFAQFENSKLGGISLESLWNHSLQTAASAKLIADCEDAGPRLLDEVFVAGMLHDTGKLALAANFPREYGAAVEAAGKPSGSLHEAEEKYFGAGHAEIGGFLLGLWGLPAPIVDAVTWHHEPQRCPDETFGPLACVHAANAWIREGCEGAGATALDKVYFEKLGLAGRLQDWHRAVIEMSGGVRA